MDEEICERTDLPVSMCAHCRPASNIDGPSPVALRREGVIIAKYPGHCAFCPSPIEQGDRLKHDDETSRWIHETCHNRKYR